MFRTLSLLLLLAASAAAQATRPAKPISPAPDLGSYDDANHLYRNRTFGFSCKVPYGWVDRTKTMSDSDSGPAQGFVLLAAFERPPEARGDDVNSTLVIAAEPVASYPGLKTATDYFTPLNEVITGKGFKVVNQPHGFTVGARELVRGDYSREDGAVTLHQTTLALLARGYVVSFTFIAGGQDEVEQLLGNLNFFAGKKGTAKPQ